VALFWIHKTTIKKCAIPSGVQDQKIAHFNGQIKTIVLELFKISLQICHKLNMAIFCAISDALNTRGYRMAHFLIIVLIKNNVMSMSRHSNEPKVELRSMV